MKVPFSWLKEFVPISVDVQTLCDKLVSIGFEVEDCVYLGSEIENVVVGKIEKIEPHPNADKLIVCKINVGNEVLQIVTGAHNVREGDIVPVAKHHSKLPGGVEITKGKLRGVESNGMLCSGKELGITEDVYQGAEVNGILILSEKEPVGEDIRKVLGLDDYVLDVAITSNRPDCNSVWGVAREGAVALGEECAAPDVLFTEDAVHSVQDMVKVDVVAPDLCPNYYARGVYDVQIAPSPLWMRRKLWKMGLRGISNMVDITNYVLMEMGQPMHAFDHDHILNDHIIVRRAVDGEKIVPLDQNEYVLNHDTLVIADEERAVGLAGIMGGSNSGISESTRAVIFEAAKFKRENIRHSSRKLGIHSDSSARFEKGVDSYTAELALHRACHLVQQLHCGKIATGQICVCDKEHYSKTVSFGFDRIQKLLGIEIPKEQVLSILKTLKIDTKIKNNVVTCVIPPYREDIERDCDIIEELIRVYGYDKIQSTLLESSRITNGGKHPFALQVDYIKEILNGLGYSETITYSFGSESVCDKLILPKQDARRAQIKLMNPLGDELSSMRTTLLPGMLQILETNMNRNHNAARLFEIGKVYLPKSLPLKELPQENTRLMIAAYGAEETFFTLKTALETVFDCLRVSAEYLTCDEEPYLHPGISASVVINGKKVGGIGQIHPTVQQNFGLTQKVYTAEIDLDAILAMPKRSEQYQPFPKYPSISRDLALVCDERVKVGEMMQCIRQTAKLLEDVSLFDIYRGVQVGLNKKSVAFSLTFRASDRTLKDAEVEAQVEKVIRALKENFNAVLRT